jgi:hypothetical protein
MAKCIIMYIYDYFFCIKIFICMDYHTYLYSFKYMYLYMHKFNITHVFTNVCRLILMALHVNKAMRNKV